MIFPRRAGPAETAKKFLDCLHMEGRAVTIILELRVFQSTRPGCTFCTSSGYDGRDFLFPAVPSNKGARKMSSKPKKTYGSMSALRFWVVVWGMGVAGQLCWNMENQWFNTFVYAKIAGDVNIVTCMVIVSALVTTVSTFVFGTMSDREGTRKKYVSMGYIIWGVTTILFGLTEYVRSSLPALSVAFLGFLVVLADAVMSFFGSMGCDCGYNAWLNDHTDGTNKGQVGAALAAMPIFGTVVGTVVGGMLVNAGNPTVGTDAYSPALDNYQLLFWGMGLFVIAMGLISLLLMRDAPSLRPAREGTFWEQLTSIFRFSTLRGRKENKEMLLACLVSCMFFIPFNFYFVHMGNWMIYDIGFTAGDMGLVEGISLLFAVLVTIPFIKLINGDKIPVVTCVAVISNAAGLLLISALIRDGSCVNTASLFTAKNLPLFLCVFLIGTGYVLIMQTGMIWVRGLFPEKNKGQFEGIRIVFFTLIPMFIGTLVGNAIIKGTPQDQVLSDVYGNPIDVPQENLFLYAGIMVLLTFIPLFFAWREYARRVGAGRAGEGR